MLTRIKRYLLPHISRIFTASVDSGTFRYSVFAFCAAAVVVNVWMNNIVPRDMSVARTNLLSAPFSIAEHMQFGEKLYDVGNDTEALREIAIAQQLYASQQELSNLPASVLGVQTAHGDIQGTWEQEHARLTQLYAFWMHVIEEKPDYRDVYVTLATIAHSLKKDGDAQRYIQEAYALDPNDRQIELLKANLELVN